MAKSKAQKEKQAKANPLSCFDALNEQLDKINVQPVVEKRPQNPHLKRVVTDRGRKNALYRYCLLSVPLSNSSSRLCLGSKSSCSLLK